VSGFNCLEVCLSVCVCVACLLYMSERPYRQHGIPEALSRRALCVWEISCPYVGADRWHLGLAVCLWDKVFFR
jgi:hypothetical protein